jgi:ribosomal-protein-alanine N-acetyltransferase
MKSPTLTSGRLLLRPYQPDDFEAFASLNANEEVRRRVGGILADEQVRTLFTRFISDECACGCEVWAITRSRTGAYVGHCWFVLKSDAERPELGILIEPRCWRRGYASEAVREMLDFAFSVAEFHQVEATVDLDHTASIRMLESVGFRLESEGHDDEGRHFVYVFDKSYPIS